MLLLFTDFFQNYLFKKKNSGILSESQRFGSRPGARFFFVLICVKNCLQKFQQTTKVVACKERVNALNSFIVTKKKKKSSFF